MAAPSPGRPVSSPPAWSDLAVVVTDLQSPVGRATIEIATSWTACGLLRPSMWIDRSEWSASAEAPGYLLDSAGSARVRIQDELARRNISMVRLLSLHVTADDEAASALPKGADEWATVHREFRRRVAAMNAPFRSGVAVVATSSVTVPAHVFHPTWSFNLMIVPEQRISDGHFPTDVTADELPEHAVAALAVVGGMASWSRGSPLDSSTPTGGNSPVVHLARTYARVIDGDGLVDDVVDGVLHLRGRAKAWPVPAAMNPAPVVADDPEHVCLGAAASVAHRHALRFEPHRTASVREPRRSGLLEGLRLFYRTVREIMTGAPHWFLDRVRVTAEDTVVQWFQRHTFGDDSDVVLTLAGRVPFTGESSALAAARLRTMRDAAMPGAGAVVPEPALWREMNIVACGLVDGSPWPEGMTPPTNGIAQVLVTDPRRVAPSVADEDWFSHPAFPWIVHPCDPLGVAELERRLVVAPTAAGGRAASEPEGGGEEAPTRDPGDARACLAALAAWKQRDGRTTSFLWRVGSAIAQALGDASDDLLDALRVIAAGPPDDHETAAELRRRRWFRIFMATMLVLLALLIGVPITLAVVNVLDWYATSGIVAAGLVVWHVVVVLCFVSYAVRQARDQFARAKALHAYYEAFSRAHTAAAAVTRFSALYYQFLDWAGVIGAVLHRPWGNAPPSAARDRLDAVPHPLCTPIGRGVVDPDQLQRCVAIGRRTVFARGWLRSVLDALVEHSARRHAVLTATDEQQRVTAMSDVAPPDTLVATHVATGEQILSPRRQLWHDAVAGAFVSSLRATEAAAVGTELAVYPVEELFSSVDVRGPAERSLSGVDPRTFLVGLAPVAGSDPAPLPLGLFTNAGRSHLVAEVHVSMPARVADDEAAAPRTVSHTELSYGRPVILASHRLDVSQAYSPADLATVRPAVVPAEEPETEHGHLRI